MIRIASMVLALSLLGCGGEEEQTPDPEPAGDPAPLYELRAVPAASYTAGQPGTFDVVLTGRGGYHVNADAEHPYPFAVRLEGPAAVTFPEIELDREDAAELTEERLRYTIPFTPTAPGSHRVTAVVDFAVCRAVDCMPGQETLAVVLPVE